MKLWFAVVVSVVAVALVVWVSAHRAQTPAQAFVTTDVPPLESAESALGSATTSSERSALGATVPPSAGPALTLDVSTTTHVVKMRSSAGIDIRFVKVLYPSGSWETLELTDGALDLGAFPSPCLVRAEGHLVAAVEKNTQEVVFEPDALFLVHAPDLRSRFPDDLAITIDGIPVNIGIVSSGFVDEEHWAAAVDVRGARADVKAKHDRADAQRQLGISLRSKLGSEIRATCTLRSGQRTTWDVPLEPELESAPLVVRVQCASDQPMRFVNYELRASDWMTAGHTRTQMSWGEAYVPKPQFVSRVGAPNVVDGAIRIDAIPLGVKLELSAYLKPTTARAKLEFVHDGSPRTIELPLEPIVRGRVRFDAPRSAGEVSWQDALGVQRGRQSMDTLVMREHAFEFQGWSVARGDGATAVSLPSTLIVRFAAVGCVVREIEVARAGNNTYDSGLVELHEFERAPWFYVTLIDEKPQWVGSHWECYSDDDPDRRVPLRVGTPNERGWPVYLDVALDLTGVPVAPELNSRGVFEWKPAHRLPGQHVVLGHECLKRSEDGTFTAVKVVKYQLHVEASQSIGERQALRISWSWHGMHVDELYKDMRSHWLSGDVWEFEAPAEGAELIWRDNSVRDDVHRIALDRSQIEVDAR